MENLERLVIEIAEEMKDINLLSNTEMKEEDVLKWASCIVKYCDGVTPRMVSSLMNKFFTGVTPYYPQKAARNFTENLAPQKSTVYRGVFDV
ncbi:hypothetical protein SAMN05443429_108111 [Cruoricaptor ignavus]|uniref:Uncharacterized protein n=1 Tax=Cruoricaptor ignavus TaxID=1118202 RepID=A0A1M6G9Y6_9FLAO|nr:hypothetical protein SAMN05443429_108111 [Cruoricaptor ignavus]